MPKKDPRTIIPTRYLPAGSRRVTSTVDGRRVWLIRGKEYASKREYFASISQPAPAVPEAQPTASADDIMNDEEFVDAAAVED
jgi:hypothetical protein